MGVNASRVVREASESVLSLLSKDRMSGSIIFTSGGTESNNLALLGAYNSKKRKIGDTLMISDSEHASVEEVAKHLEKNGVRILRIPTVGGKLDLDFVSSNMDNSVYMISVMAVNNEIGSLYDIGSAFSIAKRLNSNVITHTDAVQAFGKITLQAEKLKADMITVSSHKIHGPMGVGALFVSKNILKERKLVSTVYGGGQMSGFRSGTENYPAIAGFGAACKYLKTNLLSDAQRISNVREYAIGRLSDLDVKINNPASSAPHIVSITLPGIKSEVMLHFLSTAGIYVSSGSACSSNDSKTSGTLKAFGLSDFDADCTIRISLDHNNTNDDIDALYDMLSKGLETLIRRKK
jgi:cysteine desulfurase